ncbi:MAG TPA: SGNH/GDSL hydrolase family protein [Phycisphaerae bacterium]|nr:SGNH/GDSL hydrolase family protein [Phycisphaerae bacterium]
MGSRKAAGGRGGKWKRRIKIATAVALVALIGWGYGYFRFCLSRPEGMGPAGPAVPRELFAGRWTDRKVVMLGIGDSITAGFGVPPEQAYFRRLLANPPDEFEGMNGITLSAVLPGIESRNLSESGSTSLRHEKVIAGLDKFPPDVLGVVVMTTGGNDIIHDYGRGTPREGAMYGATLSQAVPWIEAFQKRLDRMVAALEDRFPGGCHIFLANIYDPTDGSGDPDGAVPAPIRLLGAEGLPDWPDAMEVHRRYNEAIAACARRHASVHLVDIHSAFLGHGIHCRKFWHSTYRRDDPYFWYLTFLEDPNPRGQDAIRRLFLLEMAAVLRGGAKGDE